MSWRPSAMSTTPIPIYRVLSPLFLSAVLLPCLAVHRFAAAETTALPAITLLTQYHSGTTVIADSQGNAYLIGPPLDTTFRPTADAAYPDKLPNMASTAIKLDAQGQIVYATYLPVINPAATTD